MNKKFPSGVNGERKLRRGGSLAETKNELLHREGGVGFVIDTRYNDTTIRQREQRYCLDMPLLYSTICRDREVTLSGFSQSGDKEKKGKTSHTIWIV
jgi:hypothetical protein